MAKFNRGDVVVFDPSGFNPEYWDKLPEKERRKCYEALGYGADTPKLFVFITEVNQAPGHCILIDLNTSKIECMRHINDFRLATDDEV